MMTKGKDLKSQFNRAETRDRISLTDTSGLVYPAAITNRVRVPFHEENWGARGGRWVEETEVVEFVVALGGPPGVFIEGRATRVGSRPWKVFPRQFQLPPTFHTEVRVFDFIDQFFSKPEPSLGAQFQSAKEFTTVYDRGGKPMKAAVVSRKDYPRRLLKPGTQYQRELPAETVIDLVVQKPLPGPDQFVLVYANRIVGGSWRVHWDGHFIKDFNPPETHV